MSGAVLGRPRRHPLLPVLLPALMAMTTCATAATVVDTGRAQCCSSIVPELPPATYYGAIMSRSDDPRSAVTMQLAVPEDPPGSVDDLLQRLDDTEVRDGPMAPALMDPLNGLAAAYIADNRHRAAIGALRRSIHLARLSDGLHTPQQVPMLEQLIAAYVRQGNFAEADKQQEYLYRVRSWRRKHGSAEMLDATQRYADWVRGAYIGDLGQARYPRLVGLSDLYEDAIAELEESHGPDSRELLPYLQGRIEVSYLISVYPGEEESGFRGQVHQPSDFDLASEAQVRFWRLQEHNFRYGLKALRRREDILQKDPGATAQERATAHIAIADWYQWHRRYATAIRHYEEAWAMVAGEDGGMEWLRATLREPLELPKDTVFNPGAVPILVANDAEVAVRFDVSRHGEAKDITILSQNTKDSQPGITRAYHYLRNVRFRPRLSEGSVVRAEDIERSYQVRY